MAEVQLINKVDVAGNYGDDNVPVTFSSADVTTTIVQGLTVTKSANKNYWVDGTLLYTIVVDNQSGAKLSGGTVTDVLDTTKIVFDTDFGVTINGEKTTNFTYNDGTLTVTLPDVLDTSNATIAFQVTKIV